MKKVFILFIFLISSSICALADEVLDVKLPPDYKIIVKNQDFPVTLRPHIKNGTFRVKTYHLLYKDKIVDNMVHKTQIIENDKILFESIYSDLNTTIYMNANDWVDDNMHNDYEGINFDNYIIIHGKEKDYLLYMLNFPTASERYPSYLLGYNKDNSKIILYSNDVPGNLKLSNPKNKNDEYELIDDKYINCFVFDGWFAYYLQYEIADDTIKLVDKEYEILHYAKIPLSPNSGDLTIYLKPSMNSSADKIRINEKSTVKIIGIRFVEDYSFVHVIINGKEGWIEEGDSQYIGVGRAG